MRNASAAPAAATAAVFSVKIPRSFRNPVKLSLSSAASSSGSSAGASAGSSAGSAVGFTVGSAPWRGRRLCRHLLSPAAFFAPAPKLAVSPAAAVFPAERLPGASALVRGTSRSVRLVCGTRSSVIPRASTGDRRFSVLSRRFRFRHEVRAQRVRRFRRAAGIRVIHRLRESALRSASSGVRR